MSPRRTVAHLTTTDMSLAWLLKPQLEAFVEAGWEVIGISSPGPFVAELERSGVRHVPIDSATRSLSPARDLRAFVDLVRVLREIRPTILHTHNPKPGIYGRVAGRLARVPSVVNTQHGLYATDDDRLTKRVAVWAAERFAAMFSDMELVQNPEDLARLRSLHISDRRMRLLGNGIDLARFDPDRVGRDDRARLRREWGVDDDEVVVGTVGRLVLEKGYRELFQAHRMLLESGRRVRLVVVGPEELEKSDGLTASEIAMARDDGVMFLGQRNDVEAIYPAFDAFVLASHREGMPRAAMEASAMGLAVVASDIRGCRQVVDEGVTGLLVPARDAEQLSAAMARLVEDATERDRLGAAARLRAVREFDQRRVIELTLETYEYLLGGLASNRVS